MNDNSTQNEITSEQRTALVLLIKSIMDQIDEIAILRRRGSSASLSFELLRETCAVLKELTQPLEKAYFETMLSLASSFGTSTIQSVSEEYVEHVASVKRDFIAKMRASLKVA